MNLLAFDLGLKWGWAYGNKECAIFGHDSLGKEQREITFGVRPVSLHWVTDHKYEACIWQQPINQTDSGG